MSEKKTFKVKDAKGNYLGFDFDWRSGAMNPYFLGKAMSYSFTQDEAEQLAQQLGAKAVEEP